MIYCQGYTVSFQEVPDEVSLCVLIGDCKYKCKGCHSPEMQKPEGVNLLCILPKTIEHYRDAITCVCFMGDGQDITTLLAAMDKCISYGLKVALYTGDLHPSSAVKDRCTYIKTGTYEENLGGLDSRTTNQRMWKKVANTWVDITYRFWK